MKAKSTRPRTLKIDADRFETSPYFEFYTNAETVFGVAADRYYVADLGEDPIASYWALRRDALLLDVPEKPWQIAGPDALAFLDKIFSRRIDTLATGRGRYALACTPAGGTFMDGILFKLADDRYWYVQADGAFREWMTAHQAGYDIEISDPRSRVLQLQGPRSMDIMHAASDGAIGSELRYFDAGFFSIGGQNVYVSRTGWTGELGYEIYSLGDETDHRKLWHDLFTAGAAHGMQLGSLNAMGIRRIEAGILDAGSDFDSSVTPFQAGLGAFVDLDKPDFIGRSALIDADRHSLIYGLKCENTAPRRGRELLDGDQVIGRVTAGAWSPYLECGIGYVRFARAGDWLGRKLLLGGSYAECEITELPFYDAEKRIPRGG